ncbi:uncharacterized protein DC041_0002210 [Schistosoma bovis]|uniref:Uncharacterized protein n=1 Tax=Schistosoma bovis TaxID=6184 RepID=A0A430Q5J9_SCHBO|nr:uncharacterized protein DC041_0002210 [Schistosoma bovis]
MLLNSRSLFGLTPVNGYEVQFMGFLIKVSSVIINYPMIVRISVYIHKIFLTDQQIVSFLASFYYPQEYGGQAILKTPGFLYRLFPNQRGITTGFGEAPRARQPTTTTGRFPGHGRVLGNDE